MEQTPIKAANKLDFQGDLEHFQQSCSGKDVDASDLTRLPLLYDVIQKEIPSIKKVTSVQTICDAINNFLWCPSHHKVVDEMWYM